MSGSNEGTMTVTGGGGTSSGVHWGGGGGNGNGGNAGGGNSSGYPAQAMAPYGMSVPVSPVNGTWQITVITTIEDALSALLADFEKGIRVGLPYAGRVSGVLALLAPSPLAPAMRDPSQAFVTTALPASKVLSGSLPTQPASVDTAGVNKRLADEVKDGKQHVAVVGIAGTTQRVAVVDAKPTNIRGVYTADVVPGKPAMSIRVTSEKPASLSKPAGVTPEKGATRPAGFTAGANTHDVIIRFPPDAKAEPVYVSVTGVLTETELKERQEKEKQLQAAWDAAHPLEVAQRKSNQAKAEFDKADAAWQTQKKSLDNLKASPEGRALTDPAKNPITSTTDYKIRVSGGFGGEIGGTATATIDSKAKLDYLLANNGLAYKRNILKDTQEVLSDDVEGDKAIYKAEYQEYDKLRQRLLDARGKIASTEKALAIALERRNKKEKEKKDAEENYEKESRRNKSGVATGNGKKIIGKWLENAGKEFGSPIPDKIAAKLRGKTFKNFDEFRKVLWKEISKDPEFTKDFSKSNIKRMSKGLAPRSRFDDTVGGRRSFEIHHINPISKNGEVYNMDNMGVTTPKNHINIHKGVK